MTHKINIIKDSLENKVLNYFLNDPECDVQDLVNAFDLFMLSFFSSFDNYNISSLESWTSLSNSGQEISILNFLTTKIELTNGSLSIINIDTSISSNDYTILNDNQENYTYQNVSVHNNVKTRGRSVPVKYQGYKHSSFPLFLIKYFDVKVKNIAKIIYGQTSAIDFNPMLISSRESLFKRLNIKNSYENCSQLKNMRKTIEDKDICLIENLEHSNSDLFSFINKYKMLVTIPKNNKKIKTFKF